MDQPFQIFISYARPDREKAEEIYKRLEKEGFDPWLDSRKIKGGQNWDFEIKRSLDRSSIVVIIWSENSRDRRGYVQREIKIALDKLQEKLIDDIFIIPILMNNIDIPDQLKDIHFLMGDSPTFYKELIESISHQIQRMGGERKHTQQTQDVYWSDRSFKEEWDGLPGYSLDVQFLEFSSDEYADMNQIGEYVRGAFFDDIFDMRRLKFEQNSTFHNYMQDKWARTNTFDAYCGDPVFCGKALTLNYAVNWYGAGAAHPVHGHRTFVFLLDPIVRVRSLESIFSEPEKAFGTLQAQVRELLMNPASEGDQDGEAFVDKDWIKRGTAEWPDFGAFVFNERTLDIFFSSYQVAPYVAGTPYVSVDYAALAKLMRDEYVEALNLGRFTY